MEIQTHDIIKQIFHCFDGFREKASIPNVHPHKFRHTFAIEFLRNGGNVFELQQLLGHSDLETAKKYVHLAQSDLETSIRKASPVDRWQLKP